MNKENIISIDCDGVLADTTGALLRRYDYTINGIPAQLDDITDHGLDNIEKFNMSREQAVRFFYDFFEQSGVEDCVPVVGAREIVQQLHADGYRLYVTTGRVEEIKDKTIAWIDRRFPGMFVDVIFANDDGTHRTVSKGELCQRMGASWHIDDHIGYAGSTHDAQIATLLLNQPRNQKEDASIYPGIQRVDSRQEAYTHINGR